MALSRFIAACRLKFFRAKQRSMLARLPAVGSGIGMNSPITGGSEVALGGRCSSAAVPSVVRKTGAPLHRL
jgi:hypothetical protein